jgi:hypothetical protein
MTWGNTRQGERLPLGAIDVGFTAIYPAEALAASTEWYLCSCTCSVVCGLGLRRLVESASTAEAAEAAAAIRGPPGEVVATPSGSPPSCHTSRRP